MPTETTNGWPECPETKAAHDCGGIVMTIQDARTVAGLPGFLTTMDMRWLTPNAKVSLGAEALEEADHVSTSARPLG